LEHYAKMLLVFGRYMDEDSLIESAMKIFDAFILDVLTDYELDEFDHFRAKS
jgi:hypothetical protein